MVVAKYREPRSCQETGTMDKRQGLGNIHTRDRVLQYILQLSQLQRERVFGLARRFPTVLHKAEMLRQAKIPGTAWYPLFSRG